MARSRIWQYFVLSVYAAISIPGILCLWPMPRSLKAGTTSLVLSTSFSIDLQVQDAPEDLQQAITRTQSYLRNDNLGRLVVGRGTSDLGLLQGAKELQSLRVTLSNEAGKARSISSEATAPLGSRSEEYSLVIPSAGSTATLIANSTLGLFRGLTTFEQLWYTAGEATYTLEAPIRIIDSPAFPYRGLMLDTARNFFPVSDIKRTLDAMSWAKINQFHWHVTDSQSFPLEILGFTEVAAKGAYSNSIYSPEDVKDIVSYAGARGIDVVVEIDTPGHTASIHESHPEHIACYDSSPWMTFTNEPMAGQLRFASAATTNFTAGLIEATARMFPSSLFSTGGDEVNLPCYQLDVETQRILNATGQTLQQKLEMFVQTLHGGLKGLGKTPIVWEDLILTHNVTVSNDTIVMVWSSSSAAEGIAAKNLQIVHAPSDYFYLDCGAGEWIGADPDGNSWCDPFKTWQRAYIFDPYENLTESHQHLVLGGEQVLWSEQSGPQNLDSIIWPRAAASAEVFWTGPTLPDGTPRNVQSALPRLYDLRFRMVQRGVDAIPLQPLWCALRPGACDLMDAVKVPSPHDR
ncbi:beta-hexosaminidase [Irpex rosettiformis]|uniref:Beta-hexosaminidase n=1 Tax=Irpex rosettiformis TaxID=378272 RepID=A0ACB8U2Y1_9APHY|nr:beta-hexosaminidase [Irpex rosettiformis]